MRVHYFFLALLPFVTVNSQNHLNSYKIKVSDIKTQEACPFLKLVIESDQSHNDSLILDNNGEGYIFQKPRTKNIRITSKLYGYKELDTLIQCSKIKKAIQLFIVPDSTIILDEINLNFQNTYNSKKALEDISNKKYNVVYRGLDLSKKNLKSLTNLEKKYGLRYTYLGHSHLNMPSVDSIQSYNLTMINYFKNRYGEKFELDFKKVK